MSRGRKTILAIFASLCYNLFHRGMGTDGKGDGMTKDQFVEQITEQLRKKFEGTGWSVDRDTFLKNNDIIRHALILCPPGDDVITPTVYVDDYYACYIQGKHTFPEILEQIYALIQTVQGQLPDYQSITFELEECKARIFFQLVSKEKNQMLLEECPYLPFLDLAVVFHIVCRCSEKGMETIRITNRLMDYWQADMKQLMRLAEQNTPRIFPARIESLGKVLSRYIKRRGAEGGTAPLSLSNGGGEYVSPLLIVTNDRGMYGSTAVLYRDLIKDAAEKYHTNFYMIPSSIHEVLLLPEHMGDGLHEISQMVRDVNLTRVREEDILSDHAYFYNRKDNTFSY